MSEQYPEKQERLTPAEKRGGYDAGLEPVPLHRRPGYRKAVKEAVRLGLKSAEAGEKSLSGELHEEIAAESRAPHAERYTQEQAAAENQRAHNEMMGISDSSSTEAEQPQLPL